MRQAVMPGTGGTIVDELTYREAIRGQQAPQGPSARTGSIDPDPNRHRRGKP